MNYDNWKLDNRYDDSDYYKSECEGCDELFEDERLDEVSYRDADCDLQVKFLCECCKHKVLYEGGF